MALLELMTWNTADKRWHKGYRGRRYAVSPRQLKTATNKEASRQAANQWWERKRKQIDEQLGKAKEHPAGLVKRYDLAIRNHRVYAWWNRREGNLAEAAKSDQAVEFLQEALKQDDPPIPKHWDFDPAWEEKRECGSAAIAMWTERLCEWEREQQAETTAPKENTIRAHIDDYIALKRTQVTTGKLALGTWGQLKWRLTTLRTFADPLATVETLNETFWRRFYIHLSKQVEERKMATSTMASTLIAARQFVRSRYDQRYIELPRNLNSRDLSISAGRKEISDKLANTAGTACVRLMP